MSELRVRIFPDHSRDQHFIGGITYKRTDGWYPLSEAQRPLLEMTTLHEGNPASPKLFQIVTVEEAARIDTAERKAASRTRKGTARRPVNVATGEVPEEGDEAEEMAELRAENALLEDRLAAQEVKSAATEATLAAILAKLNAAPPVPTTPEPARAVVEAEPVVPTPPGPTVASTKPGARARAARPGARPPPGGAVEAEPAAEPPAPAVPSPAAEAVQAYDQGLRDEGYTVTR